jgi:hypothetical protein
MGNANQSKARGLTRRTFTGRAAGGACVIAVLPAATWAAAHAEESDETSVSLGYRHDTKNVDKKKYPKHDVSQRCVNCAMWQGAAADPWAGCAMFGRKHIAAQGWCQAWAKKPG